MTPLVIQVLTAGFLVGIVFPALVTHFRTPSAGNQSEVGAT